MNAIFTRRSVRQFSGAEVEEEKLDRVLRAAMQAPSATNQQPWEFIVVKNRELLEKLAGFSPYSKSLAGAYAGIIVLGNTERMNIPTCWEQDLGAATENILLQAAELGLGTVWYGVTGVLNNEEIVSEMFSLPANVRPYSVIAIGYPAKEDANRFIDRFDESRIQVID